MKDRSEIEYTCPKIDEVISAIESINWDETYWEKKDLIAIMERIRKDNDSLRTWGNEKYNECESLEDQINDLEKDIKYKDNEIEDLKYEIKSLKPDVEKLEEEMADISKP